MITKYAFAFAAASKMFGPMIGRAATSVKNFGGNLFSGGAQIAKNVPTAFKDARKYYGMVGGGRAGLGSALYAGKNMLGSGMTNAQRGAFRTLGRAGTGAGATYVGYKAGKSMSGAPQPQQHYSPTQHYSQLPHAQYYR